MARRGLLESGSTPASQGMSPAAAAPRAPCAPWDARVGVGAREGALDRGVDRALEAAEILVVPQPQRAGAAIVEEQLFEREGEQGQRVATAALVDVLEQALGQLGLDRQRVPGFGVAPRRPLDHVLVGAARHRQQRQRALAKPSSGLACSSAS